ncbi:metallophosphoesterase family protein [Rasiella sp. SM2506]|uniref:metallophosphoesterase family protein n=1 Tax=Rasiella sp. SM2506 TaxID=3423914 RepID=UPI003D7A7478
MRIVVVGDIHGGLRALEQVLNYVKPSEKDTFIFLGDYVDGWSDNAETIRFLISFAENYNCIFLRGNHDELLYNYLKGKETSPMWLNHGGESSIKSYAKLSEAEIDEHLQFFERLENFHIDSQNRCYLHAGFTDQKGPAFEYFENMVYWDRTLWEMVCALDDSISTESDIYPKRLKLFKEIYIGHTPVFRIGKEVPANFANVWNVDTGAAFKGRLSMMDVDTKEIWQSDPVWKLYPDETGRN